MYNCPVIGCFYKSKSKKALKDHMKSKSKGKAHRFFYCDMFLNKDEYITCPVCPNNSLIINSNNDTKLKTLFNHLKCMGKNKNKHRCCYKKCEKIKNECTKKYIMYTFIMCIDKYYIDKYYIPKHIFYNIYSMIPSFDDILFENRFNEEIVQV